MLLVKTFTERDHKILDKAINGFIAENAIEDIIDIKFSTTLDSGHNSCCMSAMLIYRKKSSPKWNANLCANSPGRGQFYSINFEDGNHGMVLAKLDGTYTPDCKLTEEYTNKVFTTMDDAVEALYENISCEAQEGKQEFE